MSKDAPRLSRLGVLAPAALSACLDASVLAVPAAGAIVSTVLKELSKAFMLKKWFHGIMSAKEAENLIMEKGRNGSFLVRESQTHPGEYVLSVRVRGRVTHVMIRKQQDKYDVGSGEQFDDLVGLIEHFRSYPMIENSGDVLRLLQPVSGTCLRARDIDRKLQEMDDFQKLDNEISGFDGEFLSLKMVDDINVFTCNEGMKPENANKNRYRNILPYDQTRVVLRKHASGLESSSDYINASYIRSSRLSDSTISVQSSNESLDSVHSLILNNERKDDVPLVSKSLSDDAHGEVKNFVKKKFNGNLCRNFLKDKSYIATQGCLPNTTDDFWRMIWQEDVRVIAMITKEIEEGKKKCERYWPLLGLEVSYGGLTIRSISESFYEDYRVREFDVSDKSNCRTIYQYQFTTSPDHGIPPDADGALHFIDDINRKMYDNAQEKNAPEQNILCVHCSAGVGRTGTFIAIDMLINKIKHSGFNCEIDVNNTVKLLRAQRPGMVQNKIQYRFIYLALQSYIDTKKSRKKVYTSRA